MWIETRRGERVRVEVFDFSNCQRRGGGGGGLRLGGRKGLGLKFLIFLSCQRSGEGVDTSRETAGRDQATTFL
jgi:hypothetical protein